MRRSPVRGAGCAFVSQGLNLLVGTIVKGIAIILAALLVIGPIAPGASIVWDSGSHAGSFVAILTEHLG